MSGGYQDLLLGFYSYLPRDFKDSEGNTYQKPIRQNKENDKMSYILQFLYISFFSYFYLRYFFRLPCSGSMDESLWCPTSLRRSINSSDWSDCDERCLDGRLAHIQREAEEIRTGVKTEKKYGQIRKNT